MASFDFPASPVNGAVYTLNGVSYVWNGYAWMQSGGAGDVPYLPLTGGTISGNLTVQRKQPAMPWSVVAPALSSTIWQAG